MEIIRLCHEGLSSKMIAEKLNLSIHTVKNHKRNSMNKTLTHNITELIHLCIKNNWL
jgi:DNA-binding NarL/FixJ family response regulator